MWWGRQSTKDLADSKEGSFLSNLIAFNIEYSLLSKQKLKAKILALNINVTKELFVDITFFDPCMFVSLLP